MKERKQLRTKVATCRQKFVFESKAHALRARARMSDSGLQPYRCYIGRPHWHLGRIHDDEAQSMLETPTPELIRDETKVVQGEGPGVTAKDPGYVQISWEEAESIFTG